MTAQQRNTIARIEASHESQRVGCELNSRPSLTLKAQAESLYIAMMVAKEAGKLDAARALANELRPLVQYLD